MRPLLVTLALSLAACVGSRKTAVVEPLAPPMAPLVATLLAEPIGCPIYDGDDRPDYDAQGLECLVKWLSEAQKYLAAGGKPTKHTNAELVAKNRAQARALAKRVDAWLTDTRPEAAARVKPYIRPMPAPARAEADFQASQQSYLSGMIYFQKGDYEKAREEWKRAVKLDPSNSDAKAGLAKLDQLYSSP